VTVFTVTAEIRLLFTVRVTAISSWPPGEVYVEFVVYVPFL
jgi:hypothetical protein